MSVAERESLAVLARDFGSTPLGPRDLSAKDLDEVLHNLPPDLDPFVESKFIVCEKYFKRKVESLRKFQRDFLVGTPHGYRGAYLEALVQERMEHDDEEILHYLDGTIVNYVFTLQLRTLPRELDLGVAFASLKNLSSINIQCAGFPNSSPGLSMDDARLLGKALSATKALTSLAITNSRLNDDTFASLTGALDGEVACSVVNLDLGHNKLSHHSMTLLVDKFIKAEISVLASLCVRDNFLGAKGGCILGSTLSGNHTLKSLDIRSSQLGDEGSQAILQGLQLNSSLHHLCVAGNRAGELSSRALCEVFNRAESQLISVDFSTNKLCKQDIVKISSSLTSILDKKGTKCLKMLDLRGNPGIGLADAAMEVIASSLEKSQNVFI